MATRGRTLEQVEFQFSFPFQYEHVKSWLLMMISGFQISTYKLYISLLLVVLTRLIASQFMLRRP